jgi:hypothetical protein
MKKRGQFYLIAAIVIVGVVIGLAVTTNLIFEHGKSDRQKDIQDEIKLESEYVINYGVFNEGDIVDLVENFAKQYASYIGENQDVLFVFGNKEDLTGGSIGLSYVSLFNVQSGVSVTIGGSRPQINFNRQNVQGGNVDANVDGDNVNIKIGEVNYDFKLNEGENFYFVLKQPEEQ